MENTLELKVTKSVVGTLETNIEQLEQFVDEKLKNYEPSLYMGDADMAKKDRAELNNSKKVLSQARIQLMKELMKPYEDFETRCKNLEKKIDTASGKLDEIVKVRDDEERQAKRIHCLELWNERQFTLFPIDKIFNLKWLNKTAKDSDIEKEMDAIIDRTYKDLKIIEKTAPDDAETIKAHYLLSLNLEETLAYAEELKTAKETAKSEKESRAEREHSVKIEEQKKQEQEESKRLNSLTGLIASEALGLQEQDETLNDYVISIKAKASDLVRLKISMSALGIEYNIEELKF